ncbi:hypothetical protein I7331_22150 [Frankia sp. AgB1.8]|nr:hypothetical protein [Frankia sp. AgB1.8]
MTSRATAADLDEVRQRARRHARALLAADRGAVLADLLPDRWQQILGSLDLPAPLVQAEVTEGRAGAGAFVETRLRCVGGGADTREVRLRWVAYEGSWRVREARNVPARLPEPVFLAEEYPRVEAEHWEAMNRGELRVQRCVTCQTWIWGPRHLCPSCRGFELVFQPVAAEGFVYSWTRTVQPFEASMVGRVPFVVALVELPHAGDVRVAALLEPTPGEADPAIGQAVDGVFVSYGDQDRRILRWRLRDRADEARTEGDDRAH